MADHKIKSVFKATPGVYKPHEYSSSRKSVMDIPIIYCPSCEKAFVTKFTRDNSEDLLNSRFLFKFQIKEYNKKSIKIHRKNWWKKLSCKIILFY